MYVEKEKESENNMPLGTRVTLYYIKCVENHRKRNDYVDNILNSLQLLE